MFVWSVNTWLMTIISHVCCWCGEIAAPPNFIKLCFQWLEKKPLRNRYHPKRFWCLIAVIRVMCSSWDRVVAGLKYDLYEMSRVRDSLHSKVTIMWTGLCSSISYCRKLCRWLACWFVADLSGHTRMWEVVSICRWQRGHKEEVTRPCRESIALVSIHPWNHLYHGGTVMKWHW